MKKKLMAAVLAGILAAGVLAGCGGSSTSSAPVEEEKKEEAVEEAVEAGTAAAGQEAPAAAAAEAPEDNHITVAASPTPHAEILAQVKPILEAQGYELEVIEFEDYVQPNNVVDSGEIDANYFQHVRSTPTISSTSTILRTSMPTTEPTLPLPAESTMSPSAFIPAPRQPLRRSRTAIPLPSPTTPPTRRAPCSCLRPTASSL